MQSYLGLFLLSNHCQAIKNIQELEPKLNVMKGKLGINNNDTFERWHKEEESYLKVTQNAKLDEDMMPWAYVAALKKLKDAE